MSFKKKDLGLNNNIMKYGLNFTITSGHILNLDR